MHSNICAGPQYMIIKVFTRTNIQTWFQREKLNHNTEIPTESLGALLVSSYSFEFYNRKNMDNRS